MAPPPTRGSTLRAPGFRPGDGGSPAHAGIDRCGFWVSCWLTRLPRPRGDRPYSTRAHNVRASAPPPTRGSTFPKPTERHGYHGSPAHAGIDLERLAGERCKRGLPRPRGDRPVAAVQTVAQIVAPPPTRGSTPAPSDCTMQWKGSPAHAGIDLPSVCSRSSRQRLPRPRGDRPCSSAISCAARMAPPPTRGSTPFSACPQCMRFGSPAHAGIDPTLAAVTTPSAGLPRPRGDRPQAERLRGAGLEAPPPTRGSTLRRHQHGSKVRGSPAHAGIDPHAASRLPSFRRLPRPRGDRPELGIVGSAYGAAPPPTRGSTCF